MGTLWLTAIVFSFLMYTLIATFGNAGKALGVLSSSCESQAPGAFPLAILPPFFSAISPFLPRRDHGCGLHNRRLFEDCSTGTPPRLPSFCSPAFLGLKALRPLLCAATDTWWRKLESTAPLGTDPSAGPRLLRRGIRPRRAFLPRHWRGERTTLPSPLTAGKCHLLMCPTVTVS